ncbi:MAG: VWA domain-containing protein [Bdellovibrio bacteriovorus]
MNTTTTRAQTTSTKTTALLLFVATAAAVALAPVFTPEARTDAPQGPVQGLQIQPTADQRPVIDALFVLDTTGSMGGLIQTAKEKIWSIASTLASGQPAPEIRMGLVAYRDRGDDYVTRVLDLSPDLDRVHAALAGYEAQGGGDGPEDVNQALHDAVHRVSWSQESTAYKVIFLVGDAPPHLDYVQQVQYPEILAEARRRGIRVNAIQCGDLGETTADWQRIAQLGDGSYFRVDQAGGAVAIATPYDEALARLSARLDDTRLYYGSAEIRSKRDAESAEAREVQAASAPAVLARRAGYLASESGKASFAAKQELVEEVQSGRVDLDALPAEQLPAPLANLEPEARRELVEQKAEERAELTRQIKDLANERSSYLRAQVEAAGGAADSLDQKLYEAVKVQASRAGLEYQGAAPEY